MLDVALLGTGGMMPMPHRFLASALLRVNGSMILVDCGEGTQVSLKLLGWGFKSIDAILFTHYHADHISGLPGMLLTIANAGRTKPLTLAGPKGLKTVVAGLRTIVPELPFSINFEELSGEDGFTLNQFNISSLALKHRIRCLGYRFDIKRKGRFDPERAKALGLPVKLWSVLQKQGEADFEGKKYTSDMVLGAERRGLSLTYCTDTRPVKTIVPFAKESDLFICEGMYGEPEKKAKAEEYRHMTFYEAAALARAANVKQLILTHYSPSLNDPVPYMDAVKEIFKNAVPGHDRMVLTLDFDDE
ncbi:MAG: ribonuclease Z [Firmicutes bacterium]|nr:ribonuclease Z [Bacillota bacterium]